MGPRKRFRASLATSMMLAPASPVTGPEREQSMITATGGCCVTSLTTHKNVIFDTDTVPQMVH